MRSFLSLAAVLLAGVANAVSSSGDRLLVVLEDVANKIEYSKFFADLEGRGFDIAYETPKSESLSLFHLGEKSYDHILLLPTKSKGLGPNLTPSALSQFMNAKGNVLVALTSSTSASSSIVSLLNELDISLPAERTGLVVDHFNYDVTSAAEKHEVLLLPTPGSSLRAGVRDLFSPAAPNGELIAFPNAVGQTLGSGALLAPILRAPATAYSYNPKEESEVLEDLFASGQQLSLVTTFQARNSARFGIVGSADSLTDKWFDAKVKKVGEKNSVKTVNQEFAKLVSGWVFNEIGVLRVNAIEHHLNETGGDDTSNPKIYRIKNDVTYSISLSEYSWNKWTPFTLPAADELQLEFSMLSAFHRLNLAESASDESSTTYSTSFKLPDQHGIFNFLVNYKRPYFNNIEEKNTVSVRHFAHDEWPRSYVISGAWPWLAGILATTTGWIAFCGIWLYSKPASSGKESKKLQ